MKPGELYGFLLIGGEQILKVEGQKFVNSQPVTFGGIDIYICIKVFGITESWNIFYNSGTHNEK